VGATAIVATLARLGSDGALASTPQPRDGATYAAKIRREEAQVDWRRSAASLDRQLRALDPAPGAFSILGATVVKLAAPAVAPRGPSVRPGTLVPTRVAVEVACGDDGTGRLAVGAWKPAGSRWMDGPAFLAGRALGDGARFALPSGGADAP